MTINPLMLVYASRTLLTALLVGLTGIIYSWYISPLSNAITDQSVGHLWAMFLATLILYAAYPKRRRSDMTAATIALVGCVELIGFSLGQHRALYAWLSDTAGVMVAFVPTEIEQFRRLARTKGYVSFSELAREDRRRLEFRRRPAQLSDADVYAPGMTAGEAGPQ
jgi:peptidoglycan/LPS O-acetylase OafA/YrhL